MTADRRFAAALISMVASGVHSLWELRAADERRAGRGRRDHPEDETFDVGLDTRTGVALLEHRYEVPFKFTGRINKLTFELKPEPTAVAKR